jgi:hypothetical protein
MQQFHSFQDSINLLYRSMGKVLAKKGITAPGDNSNWNERPSEDDDDIFEDDDHIEDDDAEFDSPAGRPLRNKAAVRKSKKAAARIERPGVGGKKKKRRQVGEGQTGFKDRDTRIMDNGIDDYENEDEIPF